MHFQQSTFKCTPDTQQALIQGLWERGAYVLPAADGNSIAVVGEADSWKNVQQFVRNPIPPGEPERGEPADGITQPGTVNPNPPDSNVSIGGVDIPGELSPSTVAPKR